MNTLIERKARVTVSISRTEEGETKQIDYAFEQHRMTINVTQGGGQYGNAKVSIFGVAFDAMNKIARLWLEVLSPLNSDTLAIDVWDGTAYVPFFFGVITWSAINAASAPHVSLDIDANEAMFAMNAAGVGYADYGPVELKDALTTILAPVKMVVEFSELVPTHPLQRIHVEGTPMQQATHLMGCFPDLVWHVSLRRFIVRQVNEPLGGPAYKLSKDTGMIGYPTYATSGVSVNSIFDARLRLGLGLDIQTDFDFVNRTRWVIAVLQHNIQPNMPGGEWITQIAARSLGSKANGQGSAT